MVNFTPCNISSQGRDSRPEAGADGEPATWALRAPAEPGASNSRPGRRHQQQRAGRARPAVGLAVFGHGGVVAGGRRDGGEDRQEEEVGVVQGAAAASAAASAGNWETNDR